MPKTKNDKDLPSLGIDPDALLALLQEHLEIEVEDGHWTNPNQREVKILWRASVRDTPVKIASATFDVVQKR